MFTTFHLHFETKQAEMMVSAIITAEGLQRRWCFQKRLYENMANKQASLVYNCSSANEENCAPLASVATDRFEAEVWIKMSTSFDGWPTTDWSLKPPTPFCKVNSSLSVTLFRKTSLRRFHSRACFKFINILYSILHMSRQECLLIVDRRL